MRWIGLTGGIGSGKSTLAQLLREEGVVVVDADEIAKAVTQPGAVGYLKVLSQFGNEILATNGQIDRQKLGQIVFSDKAKLQQLEALLHPIIQSEVANIRAGLEKKNTEFAVYDVPLLFEKKLQNNFDAVVTVSADRQTQIARIKKRNPQLSEKEILDRLQSQISMEDKIKQSDFHIPNNTTLEDLKENAKKLVRELKSIAN